MHYPGERATRENTTRVRLSKNWRSRIIWTSDPLLNDAFAVSKELAANKIAVAKLQQALIDLKRELESNKSLLPNHYTGFVKADNTTYGMIRVPPQFVETIRTGSTVQSRENCPGQDALYGQCENRPARYQQLS